MAKALERGLDRTPSIRFRDIIAYLALAACAGTGLLAILLGEHANYMFTTDLFGMAL